MKVAALFAGIAGVELGMEAAGHKTLLFCEIDPGAQAVLRTHFDGTPIVPDVRDIETLPAGTELVTAGFPCQDISQAGTTQGINGSKSGVVANLFRLLKSNDVPNVLIENVPFMLQLMRGQAIEYITKALETLGYNWAYRVVDAHAFGLPQRRERVFLLASKIHEPWNVLFEHEYDPPIRSYRPDLACGFYWTEGIRGLGWAVDALPTIKGGSTIGIPSPPAIWLPNGRIVKPTLGDSERLQGFPKDWTLPAESVVKRGYRWKLVGNAVSVRAATWVGNCIKRMNSIEDAAITPVPFDQKRTWPSAAFGSPEGKRAAVMISKWPEANTQLHLADFLEDDPEDLSLKGVTGFINRLTSSSLKYPKEFLAALLLHQERMRKIRECSDAR